MIDRIREYLETAFESAPETAKVQELKEELFANLVDKYNDQLRQGRSEEEAFRIVIDGIGEVDELIASVREPEREEDPRLRSRRALLTAVAVMLFILCPLPVIIGEELLHQEVLGVVVMFLFIAAGVGLLIYNFMTRSVYQRKSDTMVEEFKEWQSQSKQKKSAYKAFSSAFWCLVVAAYLAFSFFYGAWAYSWLIFLIAAAVDNIVKGIMQMGGHGR